MVGGVRRGTEAPFMTQAQAGARKARSAMVLTRTPARDSDFSQSGAIHDWRSIPPPAHPIVGRGGVEGFRRSLPRRGP